jgi:hypothetical protein
MTLSHATHPPACRRGRAFAAAALALGLGLAFPRTVPAHEGHVHADEPAAPVRAVVGAPRSATSDRHELLVRAEEAAPGTPGRVHLLLADIETNAPIEGATVEVTVAGDDSRGPPPRSRPASTRRARRAGARHPRALRRLDLRRRLGPGRRREPRRRARGGKRAGRAVIARSWRRTFNIDRGAARRRKGRAAALLLLAGVGLAALTSSAARAHEGELHGDEGEPHAEGTPAQRMAGAGVAPPGARHIAKEAQFEIGLRTASVREEALAPVRTAYGTVVADPGATANWSPRDGALSGPGLALSDRWRGAGVRLVLVVDELPRRAAGRHDHGSGGGGDRCGRAGLATLVDVSRVRVEVPLYGEALAAYVPAAAYACRRSVRFARIEGLAPGGSGGDRLPRSSSRRRTVGLLRPAWSSRWGSSRARRPASPCRHGFGDDRAGTGAVVRSRPGVRAARGRARHAGRGSRGHRPGVSAGERIVVHGLAPLATAEAPRSTRHPPLAAAAGPVLAFAAGLSSGAAWSRPDAGGRVPDLNRPTVTVQTRRGARPEVEVLITRPLEIAMNGAPGVERVRSTSAAGLSIVVVEFAWGTDVLVDRQLVTERLQEARTMLPPDVEPGLGPVSSIMGEIMLIGLESPSGAVTPEELRRFAEATLIPRLEAVPGVAQALALGGGLRELRIEPHPERMAAAGVSLAQVTDAARGATGATSGGFIESGPQEFVVRNLGRTTDVGVLALTPVPGPGGVAIPLGAIADVREATATRRGDAGMNGRPAIVLTVKKQPKRDTVRLTMELERALAGLAPQFPGDAKARVLFEQSRFIEAAIHNVEEALRDGAILVVLVLALFLLNVRTTLITLTAIPLSFAVAVLVLRAFGQELNTMTLGGLAIATGEVVDDAIVDVENVFRRLRENRAPARPRAPRRRVRRVARCAPASSTRP